MNDLKIFSSTGHAYSQEERCVCAGYDNGDLKMFDLRTMSVKWETNLKNGVSIDSQHSPNYCNNNKDNNDNNSSIFSLKLGLMDFHIELRRNFTDVSVRSETRLLYSLCNPQQLEILIAAMKLMEAIWPSK